MRMTEPIAEEIVASQPDPPAPNEIVSDHDTTGGGP
jgi:hypothetical protein